MRAESDTSRRVVEVRWLPRTAAEWATFTAARLGAARLWNAMVALHARIRRLGWRWPSRKRWDQWARGRFPAISAQSVQQIVEQFLETLDATTKARKAAGSEKTARYPWRHTRYRDVTYTNQDAVLRDGVLRLSHGRRGVPLRVSLPRPLPGRLMEVQLAYGVVRIVCEVPSREEPAVLGVVGVDLGVNTLLAATDGERAVLVMSFDPVRHIRCSKPSPTKYGNVPPLGGSWSTEGPRSNYVVIAPWLHDDDVVDVNDPRVKELFELYCPFRVNQPPKLGSAL